MGRAGTQALLLLAAPFNAPLLIGLAPGPRSLEELRHCAGSPPQTTARSHLRSLAAAGVVEKRRHGGFPGFFDYRLTAAGEELAEVAAVLAGWLASSPQGPITIGTGAAKRAVRALVEGWASGIVRALAARPLCLTELDRAIAALGYPALERRLSAMRRLGLVEPIPGSRQTTPCRVTAWLRGAIAPLVAAARWEVHRPQGRVPITSRDVEAAFLLTLPLLHLPSEASGSCRLSVQTGAEARTGSAGAIAVVQGGSVASTGTRLDGSADAWALGPSGAWLYAVLESDAGSLELGGETDLAAELVAGLHSELFAKGPRSAGKETSSLEPAPTR